MARHVCSKCGGQFWCGDVGACPRPHPSVCGSIRCDPDRFAWDGWRAQRAAAISSGASQERVREFERRVDERGLTSLPAAGPLEEPED
jgi:hypothetical protein